jgi:GNAT superfamily N-acetyltransferase
VKVVTATDRDAAAWLELAASVEHLFGPMADEPGFQAVLARHLARGSALCVRRAGGPPGSALDGGILFSARPGTSVIGWLAVARARRGSGIGTSLVAEAFRRFLSFPCLVEVETFGPDHPGQRARRFYERLGFEAGALAEPGPEGGSRQWFLARYERPPDWLEAPAVSG